MSTWHKYIFTHRPPAACNSTLIRLEDEDFSLKPSNSALHKCRGVLLWISCELHRRFLPSSTHHENKSRSPITDSCHTLQRHKEKWAGIVYNTGSSGYLNTENSARTQKSAEILPGLHLPKAYSTRTFLEDQNHKNQLVTLKPPKNDYQLSPHYLWRTHDFTKVFMPHEAMEQGLVFWSCKRDSLHPTEIQAQGSNIRNSRHVMITVWSRQ